MSEMKNKGQEALDRMQRATRLSSDQRATLDKTAQAMNLALGDAIERFAKLGPVKDPRSRDLIPIALDTLSAMKKADDDFRASLGPDQVRALDEDGFDMLSRIDPMVFLRFLPPAAASPSP